MIQSHHLPTCDDVFDVLTRGPFPTGQHETDFPVERHLTVCHSCRELAEALRPVTAVLAEGQQSAGEQETQLPVFLAEEQAKCRCCVTDQTEVKTTDPIRELRVPLIGLALSLMIVLAVSGSWFSGERRPTSGATLPSGSLMADSPAPGANVLEAGFGLANCSLLAVDNFQKGTTNATQQPAESATQKFSAEHCCSQCHHAGKPSQTASSKSLGPKKGLQVTALVTRCSVCHTD